MDHRQSVNKVARIDRDMFVMLQQKQTNQTILMEQSMMIDKSMLPIMEMED